MEFQRYLRGTAKEQPAIEDMQNHLEYLSRETVNISSGNQMVCTPIVTQWHLNEEYFDIEFSVAALEFIQATDDPRREIVSVLFRQIG